MDYHIKGDPRLGDPAPWFDAKTLAGASINLGVVGGRWIALCFLNAIDRDAESMATLAELLGEASLFKDEHLVFYGVVTEAPQHAEHLAAVSHKALGFMTDYTGTITRLYQADQAPCLIVLDPQLKIYATFLIGKGGTAPAVLRQFLRDLPAVDDYAGVPVMAPALVVPRVFEPSFCDYLIGLYEENGGIDSGFMLDKDGKTETIFNYSLKKRSDFIVHDPEVRALMRERIVRRLLPAIERFFQFKATRMDRYLVSCYDSSSGGHFSRHRDNVNAGARHRRFAVSINLNHDFDGCEIIFPEFGHRRYRPPLGGAVVFSTGALHEVTPVTRGRRFAFVPFLYGDEDAREREANNALLREGELHYIPGSDRLFP